MTAIKIPLSIDQRANECLEEYGTYHRLPDLRLNDRCLIGYILKTIQDTVPEVRVDTYDNNEWTAEDLSSLEIHITTDGTDTEPKWYWGIELQASIENGCRYSIHVYSIEWDNYTHIGTVDRLTTLLAILSSGVDFSLVPDKNGTRNTIMLMKAAETGIIKGLNVEQVQKATTETYNKVGGVLGLRDYMSSLRQAIGGDALNGKPELRFSNKEGKLIFFITLGMYDEGKDQPWDTWLGTADNIIAALIITCGGVGYSGKIAPTFPQNDGLDVQTLEEAATDAYDAAKCNGNCLPICDYIADKFRGMGYGAVVLSSSPTAIPAVRERYHHVELREASSKTTRYKITPVNNHYSIINFDVEYVSNDSTLYLGRVTTVTAVIAIVCTSLSFKGEGS